MPETVLPPDVRAEIADIARDVRHGLFMLSDAVLGYAPAKRWSMVINEGVRGHFVARHLHTVLGAQALLHGWTPPAYAAFTCSSSVREKPGHSAAVDTAVEAIAGSLDPKRVLIATEYAYQGRGPAWLAKPFEARGIGTDIAIAEDNMLSKYEVRLEGGYNPRRRLFFTGLRPGATVRLGQPCMRVATGLMGVPGIAEPQPDPTADPNIVAYAHTIFDRLAQEYITNNLR